MAGVVDGEGAILNAAGRQYLLARNLKWQGIYFWLLGDTKSARQQWQQSMVLLQKIEVEDWDTRQERASVGRYLARDYFEPDHERARQLLEQSLSLCRSLNDQWEMANVWEGLGQISEAAGNYDESREFYEKCLSIRQTVGDQRGVANAFRLLARIVMYQGRLEESERIHRESIAISRRIGAQAQIAFGLRERAVLLMWLGRFAESISLFEEVLVITNDLGLDGEKSIAMSIMAIANGIWGQYEQARKQAKKSISLASETKNWFTFGSAWCALGLVSQAENAYAEAHQWFQQSITAFKEIELHAQQFFVLATSGYAVRGSGDLRQAQQIYRQVLQASIAAGSFLSLMLALPGLALFLADQGESERAVELYALAACHPFIANSQWFEDIVGQHMDAVAAALPPDVVAAAQKRGKARDLWATAKELLAEFESDTQN